MVWGIGTACALALFFYGGTQKKESPLSDTVLRLTAGHKNTAKKELRVWPLIDTTKPQKNISDNIRITSHDVERIVKEKFEMFQNQVKNGFSEKTGVFGEQMTEISAMSDSEIFEKMWPKGYRTELRKMEEIMMQDGFVKQNEQSPMASDEDMFDFYKTTLNYARHKQWVSKENYTNLLRGLTEILPEILGREKASLRRGGRDTSSIILPGGQRLTHDTSDTLVDSIIEGLSYVFSFAEPANAAWFRDIDCYKDDIPFYPIPGPNLWSFCCNCGMHFQMVGTKCVPHYDRDCGADMSHCNFDACAPGRPLGCLNLACGVWPNAIWSPLTGICGCG